MTYEEAVAAGLGQFIARPGENIKSISEIKDDGLQSLIPVITDELLKQWSLNDLGEVVILDH